MTALAIETVVEQLAHAGLSLSLAPAGGLAVAPSSLLTAEWCDLIRSSKAMLMDWLAAANDGASHAPDPPEPLRTGKNGQRCTTPTTSTAPPASPPGVAADMGNAVALAWRCGRRIAIAVNPIFERPPCNPPPVPTARRPCCPLRTKAHNPTKSCASTPSSTAS